jgi:hypothetical protein
MAEMKKFESLKHEVLRGGGFFAHLYFDMHSTDAESLQNIMVGFISKLTNEPGVRMAVGEIEEPLKGDKMFSSTAKVSMLFSDFETLVRVCMTYAPIGIDVEEPLDAKISCGEMQNAMMYISATAQDLTQHILGKNLSAEEKITFQKQMAARAELGKRILGQNKADNPPGKKGD